MIDERSFIARVESANVETLAEIFRQPTREEEETLRTYFGDERYRRMHGLALQGKQRSLHAPSHNVVVLHGIMGGELTRVPTGKAGIQIWLNIPRVVWGEFAYCRLNDDGRTEKYDIRVTGILKRYYGELLLYLHSQGWNVKPFWYDWRKDVRTSASLLESQLRNWFPDEGPVHFVAHSMGGLVVRAFMKMYQERWNALANRGSRLIMLGTPNFGSFSTVQVLTGMESTLRLLARLDFRNSLRDICGIASTFPGCYQMLPSPEAMPAMEVLYQPETWRQLPALSQRHLADARRFQQWLNEGTEAQSIYIAGYNKPTACDIQRKSDTELFPITDFDHATNEKFYRFTLDGDGTVPHSLGFLKDEKPIFNQVYYVEEEHGRLPVNRYVMQGVHELLRDNTTSTLSSVEPASRKLVGKEKIAEQEEIADRWREMHELDLRFDTLATQLSARCAASRLPSRSVRLPRTMARLSPIRPWTPTPWTACRSVAMSGDSRTRPCAVFCMTKKNLSSGRIRRDAGERPAIEIRLVKGSIEDPEVYGVPNTDGLAVDCISVGHYMGIRPQQAELALDKAISRHLAGAAPAAQTSAGTSAETRQQNGNRRSELSERDQILTQFTERGTLIGQLGQPFLLADPRDTTGQRLIAIAGMGLPGSFGVPELTVLVRELCWALGQLGKRHLAAVLIGSGSGNMSSADAVLGWLRGISQALGGAFEREGKCLQRITIVERDPRRIRAVRTDFEEVAQQVAGLSVDFHGPNNQEIDSWRDEALEWDRKDFEGRKRDSAGDAPTCMTVQMVGEAFHFGAITRDASIPERVIKIDSRIVLRANDKLAAAADPFEQFQEGRFLERLLIPRDLRGQLATRARS